MNSATHHYAIVSSTGEIKGIISQDRLFNSVPESLVKVDEGVSALTHYFNSTGEIVAYTEEESARRAMNPKSGYRWSVVLRDWVDERTLDQAKMERVREIRAEFERVAATLITGYPETERLTWGIQQSEVLAWQADNSFPTPYLDGLATVRDIDPLVMRQKTLAKVLAFMSASRTLIGTRQRLEDAVNAAESRAEVDAVVWLT